MGTLVIQGIFGIHKADKNNVFNLSSGIITPTENTFSPRAQSINIPGANGIQMS